MRSIRTAAILSLSLLPLPVRAESAAAIAGRAEALFRQGVEQRTHLLLAQRDFAAALDLYLTLHERGIRNPALYRNLGDAAFLAERWPTALWAYQMGLQFNPGDALLREHRDFARARVVYPTPTQGRPEPEQWRTWPSDTAFLLIALFAYTLASILFFSWRHDSIRADAKPGTMGIVPPRIGLVLAFLLLAVAAGFGYWSALTRRETDQRTPLIVIQENTPLYRGNGTAYPSHPDVPFLPKGMEARRLHQRGGWLQIRLSSSETGWVPATLVRIVAP